MMEGNPARRASRCYVATCLPTRGMQEDLIKRLLRGHDGRQPCETSFALRCGDVLGDKGYAGRPDQETVAWA